MDISLVMRLAGLGMIVAVLSHTLTKAGRDDQAGYVSIAGIMIAMFMLVEEFAELLDTIKGVFGL